MNIHNMKKNVIPYSFPKFFSHKTAILLQLTEWIWVSAYVYVQSTYLRPQNPQVQSKLIEHLFKKNRKMYYSHIHGSTYTDVFFKVHFAIKPIVSYTDTHQTQHSSHQYWIINDCIVRLSNCVIYFIIIFIQQLIRKSLECIIF